MEAFSIPHDIRLNEDIWRVKDGKYDHKNRYWCAWHIPALIEGHDPAVHDEFMRRAVDLTTTYEELSAIYQASKGSGAEIPLA